MLYQYVACDTRGRSLQGAIEADSEAAAEAQLWQGNLLIIDLRPQVAQGWRAVDWGRWLGWLWPVTTRDLDALCGQLADLLSLRSNLPPSAKGPQNGMRLPLPTALRLLQERTVHPSLNRLLGEISAATVEGEPLSTALEARTPALLPLTARLPHAAEERGELALSLRSLAALGGGDRSRLAPLIRASRRSMLILSGAAGFGFLLVWVFLPLLAVLEGRGTLTWPATWLIWSARLVQNHFWLILATISALALGAVVFGRTIDGRRSYTTLAWRLPVLGGLMQGTELARLCRSLALMVEAGLPWSEMLDLLPHGTPDLALQEILMQVRSDVLDGASLAEALRHQPLLPASLSEVLTLGPSPEERTQGLAKLAILTEYYEVQARDAALQVAVLLWRLALVGSVLLIAWVLAGLAPAWREAVVRL